MAMMKQEKDLNYATAGVPIVFITEQDFSDCDEFQNVLPLPASKYRYSKWHELADCNITSSMLKNPRIRKGPQGFKVDTILMLEDEERGKIDENSRKKKRRWGAKKRDYRSKLENWEQCECVNLSYQDLAHPYQIKEFIKILRKLVRAESIELIENSLSDLSSVFFPNCHHLFLQRNLLHNLKKLPKLVQIEHISLQQNNITNLDGLQLLKDTNIKSLILRDNPVSLQPNYRKRKPYLVIVIVKDFLNHIFDLLKNYAVVFELLPSLVLLDDLPRSSTDYDAPKSSCRIF